MLIDAHCHPFDLAEHFPEAESERRRLGLICAASASTPEEFAFCEKLSRQAKADTAPPILPCFAIHPQLPAGINSNLTTQRHEGTEGCAMSVKTPSSSVPLCLRERYFEEMLITLEGMASEGRLAAIGETGFDLFNAAYRETEKIQDDLFAAHLETALRHDLPLVIHARRAMHKIFAYASIGCTALKKCRAVVFHSWSGTAGEGEALLRRGINAFFSFGTTIMLNHREAMRCCSLFPADRLLTETDAPFQPLRGKAFSAYADIVPILETMAALRREAGSEGSTAAELEKIVESNFREVFGL